MSLKRAVARSLRCVRIGLASLAMFQFTLGAPLVGAQSATSNDNNTTSPIKHVIVIIGENRTFDHVFATYKPVSSDTVDNLLSKLDHHGGRHPRTQLWFCLTVFR